MNALTALNITGLPSLGGLGFHLRRVLHTTWRGLERIGQARAAAEMTRLADQYRSIDAERAAWFARLAVDCRRTATQG